MLGCKCDVCTGGKPRNQRTRSSVLFELPTGNLLVDTSPELRLQLLAQNIDHVDAVLFTHEHADHLHGLDDLRLFPFKLGHPVPLYCDEAVEQRIRRVFDYAFATSSPTHPGAAPQLQFHRIHSEPFAALGHTIQPLRLRHGPRFDVLGFRIGSIAYCTDVSEIYPESLELLQGIETLILGALRMRPHPTHFSIDQALEVGRQLNVRQLYLTHTSHELDYDTMESYLPANVHMAYDGLRVPFSRGV